LHCIPPLSIQSRLMVWLGATFRGVYQLHCRAVAPL
jgi:hypothetical protein